MLAHAHRGTILFYHGLSVGIADQTRELHSLAREGFVVIGVDNVGHGERRYADFEVRFSHDNPEFDACFLDAVAGATAYLGRRAACSARASAGGTLRSRPAFWARSDRLAYVEFEDAEHLMPEDQWDQLWRNVVHWLIRFVG